MLMRHMRMGIIMDIMIACCFIIALLLSSFITWKGVAKSISHRSEACQALLPQHTVFPLYLSMNKL